ncbi:coiled-coil domain-containing protein 9B-like isoform X2 [Scyliorhinus canicula]|uniref:coiled-coil domain-containing protein 9B-like isoform X2 n=1 Tax=Scyliorhinus canicula TaxID=7830 RepID=UPI0018F6BA60|nr:coiled-coil domain-containing protein 9B-like isoform X2 [Scyliorhinus canicula]XP_038638245.1 coiled-coil domain-containing protein 9B-like isoform X2 [Scyliorhinus canicula]XP_038638256.1 coiled-coil domain-containing protein 9B-like isoform X2 [Scyliorhinus canicula]
MMDAALDVILKTKEEKDAELDKKIEALRKKNEALRKRYQEIEEDKKRAELEGMAVTTRKNRPENLTITITKAPNEKRVVSEKRVFGGASSLRGCEADAGQRFSVGRGQRLRKFVVEESKAKVKSFSASGEETASGTVETVGEWEERRKQNIEKMNEEMEKIAEYERGQQEGKVDKNPVRNFLDDRRRSGPLPDGDKRVVSRRNVRNWGGPDFEMVKSGIEKKRWEKGWQFGCCGSTSVTFYRILGDNPVHCEMNEGELPAQKGTVDMTLLMTGRERAEYVRWKKEREQIDQERLARHKNSKGEWKRAWDANKTEDMRRWCRTGASRKCPEWERFREDFAVENELGFHKRKGGRSARKCSVRFQQYDTRDDGNHSDKTKELFPWSEATDSSKSKGKDRLTGRARSFNRLDIKEKIEIQRETGEQETEEGADDWMNGEWETVETRDSQTSSFDRKEVHRALVDAEGTLNNPRPCSSKLGNLSLAEELMQISAILHHNISDKISSDSPSENAVSGHAVPSGSDVQDLEESGNALKYCSCMSKLNKESVLVASDEISDQLSATEDHLPLKDRNPLGLELTHPNTVDDDSLILEGKNVLIVCDEEEIKYSSAADTETKSLAMSVKLQEQFTDEATEKLQSALITDSAEMLQGGQETSAPACTIGNGYAGLHPKKYREELSEENIRNDKDGKEMPGDSAVALKPSTKISPDYAILGITNTIIGMMIEEN